MRGIRVGIVNPRTSFGTRVRELLSDGRLPVTELKLFDSRMDGEAALTQFQDELVITQPLDEELFPQLDVCFFCANDTDLLNRVATDAAAGGVLSIVEGAIGLDAPVVVPGLSTDPESGDRLIAVPRPSSHLLGAIAKRVLDHLGECRVAATVLLPAAEKGDAGARELHEQVVSLLNFQDVTTDVLEEQLAFNVRLAGRGAFIPALAETISREAGYLAGLSDAVTAMLIQVPVFHAYATSMWVELLEPVEERRLKECFREAPFAIASGRGASEPSPISVAESNRIHVGGLRRPTEASRPGFWLWAVADATVYDPGAAAIEIAKSRLDGGS